MLMDLLHGFEVLSTTEETLLKYNKVRIIQIMSDLLIYIFKLGTNLRDIKFFGKEGIVKSLIK